MPALVGPKALNYCVGSVGPRREICATGPEPGVWFIFDGRDSLEPKMNEIGQGNYVFLFVKRIICLQNDS